MTHEAIIALQKRIGATPDGFWGPKSIVACQQYLRRLMPKKSPWPESTEAALSKFYGEPGDLRMLIDLPVSDIGMQFGGRFIHTIRCHRKVAESLERILIQLNEVAPWLLDEFEGCYSNRKMRGGSRPSLHARGAAIDFDSVNNGLHTHWPTAATMPLSVMEVFAREGWMAAGAFWGRDAMHFQATK